MAKELKMFIRLQAIRVERVSDESLKQFSQPSRRYFRNTNVYKAMHGVSAYCEEISNRKKFADFVYNNWGFGHFRIMGRSHGRNRFRNKPVCLAVVTITEKDNDKGYEFEFEHPISKKGRTINRIKRYWFWNEK